MDRDIPLHVVRVLLNLYTDQQIRVLWNCAYSHCFFYQQRRKTGRYCQPHIVLCLLLDKLLTELKTAGRFIGTWFVTALTYADKLILIAPSERGM